MKNERQILKKYDATKTIYVSNRTFKENMLI